MRILKAILALMLALSMLLPLVACGDEESSSSESSSSESEKQTQHETLPDSEKESQSESETEESSESEEESSSSKGEQESSSEEDDEPVTPWESNASADVIAEAEALLDSKHRLEYNDDGSFKVAIFADMHINVDGDSGKLERARENIKKIVDTQSPDLVILTGDNIIASSSEAKARQNIDVIVSYLEEKKIPWCHVYGNHDHEGSISKEAQQNIYESYEYCISKDVESLSGTGTYVHGVYNKDGSLGSLIWCIDSGAYNADSSVGGYDYIKQDQIDWYKSTSDLLQEYNNGEKIYSMMAFHIPLIENRDANKNKDDTTLVYEYSGGVNEPMCPSEVDTTLLETIWERGDVKAIVTGHDHTNDYMFNYKGVKLTSSPTISEMGYSTDAFMGSRIFDLKESTMDDIPTFVSYLIERMNPDDFDALDKDIILEDCEDGINDPVMSGWANEGLNGNLSVSVEEGCGALGSGAIAINRGETSNFEIVFDFDTMGKVGENKYIVLWMDFTSVEFRKACVGFTSSEGTESPYRTDDNDSKNPKFYYLADGGTEWQQLSHGGDGCFGTGDGGSQAMKGKKGYFAFAIDDFRQGSKAPSEDTLVSGFYFYGSLASDSYTGKLFYLDNIMLCEDYTTVELPTE